MSLAPTSPTDASAGAPPPPPVPSIEELVSRGLELVHRLVRSLCRRQGLRPEEGEELEAEVQLKLIENDHRILRQCADPDRLPSYLGFVVTSTWHDGLRKVQGRTKRPSSKARELGPVGEKLEKMLGQGETVDGAYLRLKPEFPDLDREDLEELAGKVKPKEGRRREGEERIGTLESPEPGGEERLERREGQSLKRRALALVAQHLDELPDEDRRLLVRACAGGVKVSRIARSLGLEQKPLYRRIDKRLAELRRTLEEAGVRWENLREVLGVDEPD